MKNESVHHLLSKKEGFPPYANHWRETDMDGVGPNGKPVFVYKAAGAGVTPTTTAHDPSQPPQEMTLTEEAQDILDGKEGKARAKVMKTVVAHGKLHGATKLVDLGGNPHSSTFLGPPALSPTIKIFTEYTDEGLKAYAPLKLSIWSAYEQKHRSFGS